MKRIFLILGFIVVSLLGYTQQTMTTLRQLLGGGADSLLINGVWYQIPEDTITIAAVPSTNAFNSDSLGHKAPLFYQDTIFNGVWKRNGDTIVEFDSLFIDSIPYLIFWKDTSNLNLKAWINNNEEDRIFVADSSSLLRWSDTTVVATRLWVQGNISIDTTNIAYTNIDETFNYNVVVDSNFSANNLPVNYRGFMNRDLSKDTIWGDTLYVLKNVTAGVKSPVLINGVVYYLDDSLSVDLKTATSGVLRNGDYGIFMTTPNVLSVAFNTAPVFDAANVIIAFVLSDTLQVAGQKTRAGQERHTDEITWNDHYYKHYFLGARIQSVGAISDYTIATGTDAAVTYSISTTEFHDEDVEHFLPPIVDDNGLSGNYVNAYRTSSGAWHIRFDSVPYLYAYGGIMQYNNIASVSGFAPVTNGYYINSYVLATNIKGKARFLNLFSQTQYSTLALAQAATFSGVNTGGLPITEAAVIYKITWRYRTIHTSKGKGEMAVLPVTLNETVGATATVTNDHNNLTNRNATGSHPTSAIATDTSLMIQKAWTNQQVVNINFDSLYYTMYQKADRLKQVNNVGLGIAASSATTFGCAVTTMGDSVMMAYAQNGVVYIVNYNSYLSPSITYTGTTRNTQVSIANAYGTAFVGTNLWVTNQANTLTKIDLTNSATTTTYTIPAGEVGTPYGQDIIKINDTTLAISDSTNHRIVLFYTGTSRFITYDSLMGDGVSYPYYFNYLSFDGNRTIFMSDMRGFAKFDLFDSTSGVYYYCGQINSYTSAVTFGTGIATDRQGYVYLNESYALSKWDTSGTFVGRVYNQRNISTNMIYFNGMLFLQKIASRSTTIGPSCYYMYSTGLVPLRQWNTLDLPFHTAVDETSKYFIINTYSGLSNTLRSVYVYKYW